MENKICVTDQAGLVKAALSGPDEVILAWKGEYAPGDVIRLEFAQPGFYMLRIDDCVDASIVYITNTRLDYPVLFDDQKKAYNPNAFTGLRHYIALRPARPWELGYRNLAENPADLPGAEGCYPHASANAETPGFEARNAIDGMTAVRSHGRWPYSSWGINRRDDAEITLDFGRPVDFDTVVLYTRADFPHDNWWVEGTLTFSDGTTQVIALTKSYDPQPFRIEKKGITWLKLGRLIKSDDPSPFPALTQIQVYGTESR